MLPIDLPNGVVAVYGMGTTVSSTGIEIIDQKSPIRFGQVYQVYAGGAVFVYNGDYVMFNNDEVVGRIVYQTVPYTLVPARLVTKEQPLL